MKSINQMRWGKHILEKNNKPERVRHCNAAE